MAEQEKKPQSNSLNKQSEKKLLKDYENMSEEEQQAFLIKVGQVETFSGPLPHPKILKQYAEISEDFPREILNMAKEEAHFRHEYEKKEQHMSSRDSLLGMIFSFLLCFALIACGIWLALSKSPAAGTILSSLGVGSVVITVIQGTRPNKRE